MRYLIKNAKSSWISIKQNKVLFLLVIFLEFVFLSSLLYVGISDHLKIIENAQNIIEPLSGANFDVNSIQSGEPFLEDFNSIEKSAQLMKKGLIKMLGKLFVLFIIFNGLIWTLINIIITNRIKFKSQLQAWSKFLTSSTLCLGLLFIFIKIIIKSNFTMEFTEKNFKDTIILISLITIGIYYLLTVSFAFLNTKDWKEFLESILHTGFLKINKTGIVALINIAFISISIYLIYISINNLNYSWLLIPTIALFVFILAITKIYWIINLQHIFRGIKK